MAMSSKIKEKKLTSTSTNTALEETAKRMPGEKRLYSTMFEVFGRVQGVYFRKHTQLKAKQLGLCGWCMNTQSGTVKGIIEGPQDIISEMKLWLQYKGSPRSRIEKAVFTDNEPIPSLNFSSFTIKR